MLGAGGLLAGPILGGVLGGAVGAGAGAGADTAYLQSPKALVELTGDLRAADVFGPDGTLTDYAVNSSRKIMERSELGNPSIPEGFDKWSTKSFPNPTPKSKAGDWYQVHFYINDAGTQCYDLDYKVQFNK